MLAVFALAAAPARAASATNIKIVPGPTTMSPEEAAIVADPAAGSQHGVVLVEETERDESSGFAMDLTYHMRAKILSAEGRALANVEIPGLRSKLDLRNWWGRTILPGGEVLELAEKDLKIETTARVDSWQMSTLKAALPGVVPGCVVDFGYEVRRDGVSAIERVALQKQWPVRVQRYRWKPSTYFPATYIASQIQGKPIEVKLDRSAVLVTAKNLAPVLEEPYMPPMEEVRASVILYYTESNETPAEYWTQQGKDVESRLKRFLGNGSAVRDTLASMAIPPDAPLEEKLKKAYEWIGKNLVNTNLLSAEEEEKQLKPKQEEEDKTDTAKEVLAAKRGKPTQLDMLFAGMARALGAEAHMVYATDRTSQYWIQALKSMAQFDFAFVKVRVPGAEGFVLVDAGSGLRYGEVPWQATGISALECTAKGGEPVKVRPAEPKDNRADTKVALEFGTEEPSIGVKWGRSSTGAAGMSYRRWLRDLDPEERKKTVDEMCGGTNGSYDVIEADLPGLAESAGPYQIQCNVELAETGLDEGTSRYTLDINGPWFPPVPDFPSATRANTVVFEYPRVDIVSIDVKPPSGFRSTTPPAPVRIDSPFGRYILQIRNTETGVHVDRMFALTPLIVDVGEYPKLRSFLQDAAKNDHTPLVFDRKAADQ
jgi:hypothetical protein